MHVKMYCYTFIFVLFAHIFRVNSVDSQNSGRQSVDICGLCLCAYKDEKNQDFVGETVDCSYKSDILNVNYSLPSTVHSLDLSTSGLKTINASKILTSKSLEELLLSHNDITAIDPNSFSLPELRRLDLSYNKLEVIHENVFHSLNKLEYLNLANNGFSTFTKLTFHHLSNLRELVLDYNNLGNTLREHNLFERNGFGVTYKIHSLSIKGIGLGSVPENFFSDVYDLRKLIISNNGLTELFEIPYTLQYLDISNNPIKQIFMEDFLDLPALKVLKANNLLIKTVPDFAFSSLKSLVHLELERNRNLAVFSKLAFGPDVLEDADDFTLETLSLKGSRLKSLDEELMEPFGHLTRLDLQGNPWKCDCKLVWIKRLQIAEKDYQQLRCTYPPVLSTKRIIQLDSQLFACPAQKQHIGLIIAAISLCAIFSCLAIWMAVFLPKWQTRSRFMKDLVAPTAAYTVLPMGVTRDGF